LSQAEAVCELFGGKKEDIRVIGIRHGEKIYETLLTNEECAKAEDMGDFYRVPADNRTLNYDIDWSEIFYYDPTSNSGLRWNISKGRGNNEVKTNLATPTPIISAIIPASKIATFEFLSNKFIVLIYFSF
jgi:hypothetical protein